MTHIEITRGIGYEDQVFALLQAKIEAFSWATQRLYDLQSGLDALQSDSGAREDLERAAFDCCHTFLDAVSSAWQGSSPQANAYADTLADFLGRNWEILAGIHGDVAGAIKEAIGAQKNSSRARLGLKLFSLYSEGGSGPREVERFSIEGIRANPAGPLAPDLAAFLEKNLSPENTALVNRWALSGAVETFYKATDSEPAHVKLSILAGEARIKLARAVLMSGDQGWVDSLILLAHSSNLPSSLQSAIRDVEGIRPRSVFEGAVNTIRSQPDQIPHRFRLADLYEIYGKLIEASVIRNLLSGDQILSEGQLTALARDYRNSPHNVLAVMEALKLPPSCGYWDRGMVEGVRLSHRAFRDRHLVLSQLFPLTYLKIEPEGHGKISPIETQRRMATELARDSSMKQIRVLDLSDFPILSSWDIANFGSSDQCSALHTLVVHPDVTERIEKSQAANIRKSLLVTETPPPRQRIYADWERILYEGEFEL